MSDGRGVLMLFYDLPASTPAERRTYCQFRKKLIRSGFQQMQESVYIKLLRNMNGISNELHAIRAASPTEADIRALPLKLNEFRKMEALMGPGFNMALFADDVVFSEMDDVQSASLPSLQEEGELLF